MRFARLRQLVPFWAAIWKKLNLVPKLSSLTTSLRKNKVYSEPVLPLTSICLYASGAADSRVAMKRVPR